MKRLSINPLLFLLLSFACTVSGKEIWKSKDGRELKAVGVSWNRDGVKLKRTADNKIILVKYKQLDKTNGLWAIENLPFDTNDEIRLRAKSVATTTQKKTRETGSYTASVSLFSYDGYNIRGTASFSPILEHYKISGRTVEAEISSISGPGFVALEFYAISGKGQNKRIYHSEKGIVEFRKIGSIATFSCPAKENLNGWVVIARSASSGEIIESVASLKPLESFILSRIPKTAVIKSDVSLLKAEIRNLLSKK